MMRSSKTDIKVSTFLKKFFAVAYPYKLVKILKTSFHKFFGLTVTFIQNYKNGTIRIYKKNLKLWWLKIYSRYSRVGPFFKVYCAHLLF